LAAAIGLFIYRNVLTQGTGQGMPPGQQIDTVAVEMDLHAIARAEKVFLVTHGRYGTIEELTADGAIPFSGENRHGYTYTTVTAGDSHFRIIAAPFEAGKAYWPRLSVDETMQVVQAQ